MMRERGDVGTSSYLHFLEKITMGMILDDMQWETIVMTIRRYAN